MTVNASWQWHYFVSHWKTEPPLQSMSILGKYCPRSSSVIVMGEIWLWSTGKIDQFLLIPDVRNIKLHGSFETPPCRIVSVLRISLILIKLYEEEVCLYFFFFLAIRLFENMPGLIPIYWCHLYCFKSAEQNKAKFVYRISWPNSRAFTRNIHVYKFCCQNRCVFKENGHLLATQSEADEHRNPKGMQVFSM